MLSSSVVSAPVFLSAILDHATRGRRLVLQVLHDSPGRLDSLWLAHISTLSSSCLGFCAPGCAQTACSHLLLLSSGAQLYCQTNSRPGQQDIIPGLLSRYWQISCHVTGDQLQTWYGEALGRGVWGHAPSEKFWKIEAS